MDKVYNLAKSSLGIMAVFAALFIFHTPVHASSQFQIDSGGTLKNGLISYWKFDQDANDFFGSTNNLSGVQGPPLFEPGKIGNAVSIDSTQYATHPYLSGGTILQFERTDPFSFSCWVRSNLNNGAVPGNDTITDKSYTTNSQQGYFFQWIGGSTGNSPFRFVLASDIPSQNYLTVQTNDSFGGNEWHHVVLTYDGSSQASGVHIFVDDSNRSLAVLQNSLTSSIVGNNPFLLGVGLDGKMDECGVWSRVLTQSEVDDLWNGGSGQTMVSAPTVSISNLSQFKSDATSSIANGGTTTEDTVVFGATLNFSSTNSLRLEVEYTTSTLFTGIANATSVSVSPGTFATATISGLPDGNYHWRARAVDASTSAASAWADLGNGSNPDFVVHQVPLYTQVISQFPPRTVDQEWATKSYGTGNYSDCLAKDSNGNKIPNTSTNARCGCAITAAVMMLRYQGITTDVNGDDVNPLTLNAYLSNPPQGVAGYDADGNLTNAWNSGIIEYAKNAFGVARVAFFGKYSDTSSNLKTLYIDPSLTSSSQNPVILYEQGLGSTPDHFIVASAKLASTYAIRDPNWYETTHLTQVVRNSHQRDYANQVSGVRLYGPLATNQILAPDIVMTIASPAELLVTDPNGHRLGTDPIASTTYNEISGASYIEEGISDPTATTTEPAVHRTKSIYIPNPLNGVYAVNVIGTASGTYEFTNSTHDASSTLHLQVFNGSTQTNLVTSYSLSYATSSVAVTSQINFSGFLDPVKADGTGLYKQGRTLPVKFQLTNASGTIITDHTAQLFVAKIQDNVVGTDEVALSTGGADTGNYFRVSGNQYIYNLNTGFLTTGTWQLKAKIDDGTEYAVTISIKQ